MVSNANANNIPAYSLHSKFVENIMDSMVLWYDIKRQGATNQSMSQKPVLRDLSGNRHDATCYNFAWSGMSSIGGYSTSFLDDGWAHIPEFVNANDTSCIFTKARNSTSFLYHTGYLDEFNIKVTGITDTGCRLEFGQGDIEESEHSIKSDGVYTIPAVTVETTKGFKLYGDDSLTFNIKIELLSQYPNALVSDGVDDYATVTNLPAQYPNGYTVVVKRDWLNTDNQACLCGNRGDMYTDSAFNIELLNFSTGSFRCDSFKYQKNIDMNQLQRDGIIYQKTFDYNGQAKLNPNNVKNGHESVTLFKLNPDNTSYYNGAIALYSFLLFNRDLTDNEIEWVKTNLINNSPLFNVYSFRSANIGTQITYAVNDTLVINTTGEQGTWLVRGYTDLLKTSFNITCDRPMYLAIADTSTDGSTVNKQKRYFNLQAGLNTVPAISDEDLSQYNTLVICRPLDDSAGRYTIKAL